MRLIRLAQGGFFDLSAGRCFRGSLALPEHVTGYIGRSLTSPPRRFLLERPRRGIHLFLSFSFTPALTGAVHIDWAWPRGRVAELQAPKKSTRYDMICIGPTSIGEDSGRSMGGRLLLPKNEIGCVTEGQNKIKKKSRVALVLAVDSLILFFIFFFKTHLPCFPPSRFFVVCSPSHDQLRCVRYG